MPKPDEPSRPTTPRRSRPAGQRARRNLASFVPDETLQDLAARRRWALDLDPERMRGIEAELRMLRQALRDAFVVGDNAAVRQHAEALRRLLRERAIVPELEDGEGEDVLEDGLSADLRRILQRVGVEMGVDA